VWQGELLLRIFEGEAAQDGYIEDLAASCCIEASKLFVALNSRS